MVCFAFLVKKPNIFKEMCHLSQSGKKCALLCAVHRHICNADQCANSCDKSVSLWTQQSAAHVCCICSIGRLCHTFAITGFPFKYKNPNDFYRFWIKHFQNSKHLETKCQLIRILVNCCFFISFLEFNRKFEALENLASHVTTAHAIASATGLYYCRWEKCARSDRGFNARYKMLVHVRTHTKEKPHHCTECTVIWDEKIIIIRENVY